MVTNPPTTPCPTPSKISRCFAIKFFRKEAREIIMILKGEQTALKQLQVSNNKSCRTTLKRERPGGVFTVHHGGKFRPRKPTERSVRSRLPAVLRISRPSTEASGFSADFPRAPSGGAAKRASANWKQQPADARVLRHSPLTRIALT